MSAASPTINVAKIATELSSRYGLTLPTQVVKRDGSSVKFDLSRIERAVLGAYGDLETWPGTPVEFVVQGVANTLASKYGSTAPTVEKVSDVVELTLLGCAEHEAARAYMTYRVQHAAQRGAVVPAEIREQFEKDKEFFPTPIQEFQFYDKYSRFNWDNMRRETWLETVDRNVDYLRWLVAEQDTELPEWMFQKIHQFIREQRAMPSMRSLAMAGEAAKRNALSIYNCSYMPVKDIAVFGEMMRVSMAGCGVGFSVERVHVEQLPRVARQTGKKTTHWVEDSTDGWADSLIFGLTEWFAGRDVEFNYDFVRPKGTPLKVKGGRASGPAPLKALHDFCRTLVLSKQGTTLTTVDAHDMACATGGAAVSGGVRRTAMISLFDWDDVAMRECKNGANVPEIRWNANNSAVWPDNLDQVQVIDQMMEMVRGGRGEPGIFSRSNANRTRPERRAEHAFGTNPCGEINLREFGLCNLSIAVARPEDTEEDLREKVEVAAWIGTIQSLATNFPGLRPEWAENCVEERLLGVDLNAQRDCAAAQDPEVQRRLRDHAVETNRQVAEMLGINQSASVTCNKPSGNSSVLLNTASGIHARWAPFYIRRTRTSSATPLYRVLKDAGVPLSPENGQTVEDAHTWVASWPVKAPEGTKTRKDFTAIEQCDFWLQNKLNWTEHNPSVTVTYQPHEVLDMLRWVWDHREQIGGMAFLPADDAQYDQAPLEEITEAEYERLSAAMPEIDFSLLYAYEHTDMTTAAQELACLAGACEV